MPISLETWKDVPGYENLYQVSDFGRVRSLSRFTRTKGKTLRLHSGKMLRPQTIPRYGLVVNLCKFGKLRQTSIPRLVLLAFVGPCPEGMECCHFPDRDVRNNKLNNLR